MKGVLVGIGLVTWCLTPGGARAQEAQGSTVSIDGHWRTRGEWDGRTTNTGDDAAVLSRIRIGVSAQANPWLRAYAQIQDARAWGTEIDPTEGSADVLDLHQGFVELHHESDALRIGRQQVALGDERLVGPLDWANTGRSFDGILGRHQMPDGEVRLLWMNVHERDAVAPTGLNPQANEGTDGDGWLIGAFLSHRLGGGTGELLLLHDRNAATALGTTDKTFTAQGRLFGAAGSLKYDASLAAQLGSDLSAFLFSGMLGWPLGEGATIAGQLDYVSGDGDPLDGVDHAFRTMYPTGHKYFGYMDYFLGFPGTTQGGGLIDAIGRVSTDALPGWLTKVDVHYFALARERALERALGVETDLTVSRRFPGNVALDLGASLFLPADGMGVVAPAFAGGTDPSYWLYSMFTVAWP